MEGGTDSCFLSAENAIEHITDQLETPIDFHRTIDEHDLFFEREKALNPPTDRKEQLCFIQTFAKRAFFHYQVPDGDCPMKNIWCHYV